MSNFILVISQFFRMIKKHIILGLIVVTALCSQYVPIPKAYPGFFQFNKQGPIQLVFICDPMCDDCADWFFNSFEPSLKKISQEVVEKNFGLRILPFAKPAHITAHKIIQACLYIDKHHPGQGIQSFYYFLNNTKDWNESSLMNQSINQWMGKVADYISSFPDIDKNDVLKQLAHGSDTESQARYLFKHIVGSTISSFTPTLYINGARVDDLMNKNADDMYKLLMSLL